MKRLFSAVLLLSFCVACGAAPSQGPEQAPVPAPSASAPSGGSETDGAASLASAAPEEPLQDNADALAHAASTSEPKEEEPATASEAEPRQVLQMPQGTKVLHVGDSFAGALGLPLSHLLEDAGVKSVLKHTDASYLTDWAWNGELQKMIWKYNPDLVLVTLGANELAIVEPEQRIKTIRKIISMIEDRPCLWVGIPLWNGKQNGLMDIIKANVGPCVYWDSNELIDVEHMPRIQDGIHPTKEAREQWAVQMFGWLKEHRAPTAEKPWVLAP